MAAVMVNNLKRKSLKRKDENDKNNKIMKLFQRFIEVQPLPSSSSDSESEDDDTRPTEINAPIQIQQNQPIQINTQLNEEDEEEEEEEEANNNKLKEPGQSTTKRKKRKYIPKAEFIDVTPTKQLKTHESAKKGLDQ